MLNSRNKMLLNCSLNNQSMFSLLFLFILPLIFNSCCIMHNVLFCFFAVSRYYYYYYYYCLSRNRRNIFTILIIISVLRLKNITIVVNNNYLNKYCITYSKNVVKIINASFFLLLLFILLLFIYQQN